VGVQSVHPRRPRLAEGKAVTYEIHDLDIIVHRHVEAAHWRAFWYGFVAGAGGCCADLLRVLAQMTQNNNPSFFINGRDHDR